VSGPDAGSVFAGEETMQQIDHLIYAVPDLERGMDSIERRLGVRPVPGGRHPAFGTHNALLSLGPTTYLEVIAPDSTRDPPDRGRLFGVGEATMPSIVTWVLRREAIEQAVSAAAAEGLALGEVQTGSRTRPDGTRVSWRVTDPYAMPLDGAVPFLIAWGDTPHPAAGAPCAGVIAGLEIIHPEPARVRAALAALDTLLDVRPGPERGIRARIRTDAGEVVLE
jgi:hypothetical protein